MFKKKILTFHTSANRKTKTHTDTDRNKDEHKETDESDRQTNRELENRRETAVRKKRPLKYEDDIIHGQ